MRSRSCISDDTRYHILGNVIEDFAAGKGSITEVRYIREQLLGPDPNAWNNFIVPLADIIYKDVGRGLTRLADKVKNRFAVNPAP